MRPDFCLWENKGADYLCSTKLSTNGPVTAQLISAFVFATWIVQFFNIITEPLQKLRVRLGTCKTGLSPPVTLCY